MIWGKSAKIQCAGVLVVGLLFAAHSRGELLEPGFEPQAGTYEHTVWLSRYSGGNAEGGRQSAADGAKVRSGKHAFRLAIHPEKGKRVRSWAGSIRPIPSKPVSG